MPRKAYLPLGAQELVCLFPGQVSLHLEGQEDVEHRTAVVPLFIRRYAVAECGGNTPITYGPGIPAKRGLLAPSVFLRISREKGGGLVPKWA